MRIMASVLWGPWQARRWPIVLLPAAVLAAYFVSLPAEGETKPGSALEPAASQDAASIRRRGRIVFAMIDSLPRALALDPAVFPSLEAMRPRSLHGTLDGCLPSGTVTCARTMLEGNSVGYLAGMSNFSASRAGAGGWPSIVARAGLRVALVSDHTFNRMYAHLATEAVDLGQLGIPHLQRNEPATEAIAAWLRADVADVYLVHILDMDKAGHLYGAGDPRYEKAIRTADAAIATMDALLTPQDTLIVVGDHGHDGSGSHVPETAYVARGPAFRPGRLDLRQPTIALLLAAASGTALPPTYEGDAPLEALTVRLAGVEGTRQEVAGAIIARRDARQRRGLRRIWSLIAALAAALLVFGALALRGAPRRRAIAALAALAAGALAATMGAVWGIGGRAWFWLGPPINLLHYSLALGGLLVVLTLATRRLTNLPLAPATGAALLLVPFATQLPKRDYFSSTWHPVHFFIPAVLLLLAGPSARKGLLALVGGAVSLVVLRLHLTGESAVAAAGWLLAGPVLLSSAVVIAWAARGRARLATVLPTLAVLLVLAIPAQIPLQRMLGICVVAVTAALLSRALRDAGRNEALLHALVAAIAVTLLFFVELWSMRLLSVNFRFAFRFVVSHPVESVVAAQVIAVTTLKYGLLIVLAAQAVPRLWVRDDPTARIMLTLLVGKTLVAGAWAAGARLDLSSRTHAVPTEEAILFGTLALVAWLGLSVAPWAARAIRHVPLRRSQ